jgi:hypothetical protein
MRISSGGMAKAYSGELRETRYRSGDRLVTPICIVSNRGWLLVARPSSRQLGQYVSVKAMRVVSQLVRMYLTRGRAQ